MKTNKLTLQSLIAVPFGVASLLAQAGGVIERFEQPVELLSNGIPINADAYPSPTLYDLDGDGQRELVIGGISGNITSTKKAGEELTIWGETAPVLTANGDPLKLENW